MRVRTLIRISSKSAVNCPHIPEIGEELEPMNFDEVDIMTAALGYHAKGFSIVPMRADKRPAVRWKQFQKAAPDEGRLRAWFDDERFHALAVVLGPVSGDLACRDFDRQEAYQMWKDRYPEEAEHLPTVKTYRGYHVYFKYPGCKLLHFDDGELRGAGGVSILPPSRHVAGIRYQWIAALPPELPIIDPAEIGLIDSSSATAEAQERSVIEEVEEVEEIEDMEEFEESEKLKQSCGCVKVGEVELSDLRTEIDEAISKNLPQGEHTRNHCLFQFARSVKALPQLADIDPGQLKPCVKEWHKRALPNIATKDFDETWFDFLYGWDRVKYPKGQIMKAAIIQANANPVEGLPYESPRIRTLVSLCRALQDQNENQPFFLSANMAGQLLEIHPMQAHRWLCVLEREGWIKTIQKGDKSKATRYRYIGLRKG